MRTLIDSSPSRRATAEAFAQAGAAHVALLGRRMNRLSETEGAIVKDSPNVKVSKHIADVTDESRLAQAAKEIAGWDVLVINAAINEAIGKVLDVDLEEWWRVFEVGFKRRVFTSTLLTCPLLGER